jgi:membrane protease YdiL (CAAX protease family)
MEADRIEIKTVLISLAVVAATEVTVGIVSSMGACSPIALLGAVRFFETALIVLIVLIREGGLFSIGLAPSSMIFGLKRGLVWSAGFGTIVLLVFAALFAAGINPIALIHTRLPAGQSKIILFFLIGGIVSPVAEEIFFRGILYRFFRRWGGLCRRGPEYAGVCPGPYRELRISHATDSGRNPLCRGLRKRGKPDRPHNHPYPWQYRHL